MNSFPKHSRLCGQLRIKALYRQGAHFTAWPMRVTFMTAPENTQVLVWAPKSLFKRAVKRNRLRRLMREAFRTNCHVLDNKPVLVAFNYMDKEEQPYAVVEKAVRKALKKIADTQTTPSDER
jgi:ribonuclease P protein component